MHRSMRVKKRRHKCSLESPVRIGSAFLQQCVCLVFAQKSKDLQPLVSEWIDHQIPARSLAEVTDLQTAIVFMASPASNYMVSVCIGCLDLYVHTYQISQSGVFHFVPKCNLPLPTPFDNRSDEFQVGHNLVLEGGQSLW